MPLIRKMSADLLTEAASFYVSVGNQNPDIAEAMQENTSIYRHIAVKVLSNPMAPLDDSTTYEIAASLLHEAANFFRSIASQNEAIKDQMEENANIYDQMASLLKEEPMGEIPD